jgi:hypothetical protein
MATETAADQTAVTQTLADHTAADQLIAVQELADCIVVGQTVAVHIGAGTTTADTTAAGQTVAAKTREVPELRHDDPRAIYQRYVTVREAWYKAQPRGSFKTNQQYRKAMGLPQRYNRVAYQWCLDWKQMGQRCIASTGIRDWTKEEMMAYLDWCKAEDDRVEAQVAKEMKGNPFTGRRGIGEIWRAAEKDLQEQEALYFNN